MTSHLTWCVQLVLPSLFPTPTLSEKSQKPFCLGCKHLISILKALQAYAVFFFLNDQLKFYCLFSQHPIIPISKCISLSCFRDLQQSPPCYFQVHFFKWSKGELREHSTFFWETELHRDIQGLQACLHQSGL